MLATAILLLGAGPARKWEDIPASELAETAPQLDPGADAEAIFVRTWLEDLWTEKGFAQLQHHYVRIKVFTAAGAEKQGQVRIDLPLKGASLAGIQGRTVHPDGSIVELDRKTVLKDVVYRQKGTGVRRVAFALPAVTPGSIIEYRYRADLKDQVANYQVLSFQSEIPRRRVSYFLRPLTETMPSLEGWSLRQISYRIAPTESAGLVGGYYEISALDLPAYVEEPDAPPKLHQQAWTLLYYTEEKATTSAAFWQSLAKRESRSFDAATRPDAPARDLARTIAGGATGDSARVVLIADWIQREFRVVDSGSRDSLRAAGLKQTQDGRAALRQRGGTAYDACTSFATLLRGLGLETRLLRLPATRRWPFDREMMDPLFLDSFDVAVRVDGAWKCFDPSSRYLPRDMLRWSEESQSALLCDPDSGRFLTTPVASPHRSMVSRRGDFSLLPDGSLDGDVTVTWAGHLNDEWRTEFAGASAAEIDSAVRHEIDWGLPGIELTAIVLERGEDSRDPLQLTCHVRVPRFATLTGRRVVLEPAVFQARRPARFQASTRRHPVFFTHAWAEIDWIRFRLPESWTVEGFETPAPVDAPGVAKYRASLSPGSTSSELDYSRVLEFGQNGSLFFPASSYPQLKRLFDGIHDRDALAITLVRGDGAP